MDKPIIIEIDGVDCECYGPFFEDLAESAKNQPPITAEFIIFDITEKTEI